MGGLSVMVYPYSVAFNGTYFIFMSKFFGLDNPLPRPILKTGT